jgi:hypothetical protein
VNGGPGSYSMPSSMLRLVLKSRVPPVCPQGLAREQRFCSFGTKFIEIARGALSNCILKHFPATVQPGDLGPPTENAVIRRMTGSQGRDCTETTIWARSRAALEVWANSVTLVFTFGGSPHLVSTTCSKTAVSWTFSAFLMATSASNSVYAQWVVLARLRAYVLNC